MGRFRQITRTIEYTEADIVCADLETNTIRNITLVLSGTYKSNDKLLLSAQAMLSDTQKALSVDDMRTVKKSFCLSENEFLKLAIELPAGKNSMTKDEYMSARKKLATEFEEKLKTAEDKKLETA